MAENKKSFVLYSDMMSMVEKLPPDKAGMLFLHILKYVNDLNPVSDDVLVDIAFEPIKMQLKRDLTKWGAKKEKQSEGGKLGMEKRWGKPKLDSDVDNLVISNLTEDISSITVNDNVSVNVNDNVSVIKKSKPKKSDALFLPPTLLEVQDYFVENGFGIDVAKRAFNFYDIADWKDSKGNKVKNWKQKMQGVWFKDENKEKKHFDQKKESINGLEYRPHVPGNLF